MRSCDFYVKQTMVNKSLREIIPDFVSRHFLLDLHNLPLNHKKKDLPNYKKFTNHDSAK